MARKEIAKVKGRDAIRQKRWDMVLDPHSERCWLLPFRVGLGGKIAARLAFQPVSGFAEHCACMHNKKGTV